MFKKFKTKYRKLEEAYEKLFDAYNHMEIAFFNCDRALNGNELQLKYYGMLCDFDYQVAKACKEESLSMLPKKKTK